MVSAGLCASTITRRFGAVGCAMETVGCAVKRAVVNERRSQCL